MKNLVLLFCICMIIPTQTHPETKALSPEKQKALKEINQKIESNKKVIAEKKRKKQEYSTKLGHLKRNLRLQKSKIRQINQQLFSLEKQTQLTQQNIRKLTKEFDENISLLSQRLLSIYKNEDLGVLSFIFSPSNFMTALEHSHYFEKLMKADLILIQTLQDQHTKLKEKQTLLSSQKQATVQLKQTLNQRKVTLESNSRQIAGHVSVLEQQINEFEKRNRALMEDSQQIGSLIRGSKDGERSYYATDNYLKPSKGWISSRYGKRRHPIFKRLILHTGIDIAAPRGRKILSTNNGYVLFAGWKKGYGNVTIIDHGWKNGKRISSVYAHQWRMVIRKGQYVNKGQLIGYVGSTGYSTGPHLHFEIRENGSPINPTKYVRL